MRQLAERPLCTAAHPNPPRTRQEPLGHGTEGLLLKNWLVEHIAG
jgi:hypothetical protein